MQLLPQPYKYINKECLCNEEDNPMMIWMQRCNLYLLLVQGVKALFTGHPYLFVGLRESTMQKQVAKNRPKQNDTRN